MELLRALLVKITGYFQSKIYRAPESREYGHYENQLFDIDIYGVQLKVFLFLFFEKKQLKVFCSLI